MIYCEVRTNFSRAVAMARRVIRHAIYFLDESRQREPQFEAERLIGKDFLQQLHRKKVGAALMPTDAPHAKC